MSNFIENANGKFGEFGGCFAPELLQPVLNQVKEVFEKFKKSAELQQEFRDICKHWGGRPTPIYFAENTRYSYMCIICDLVLEKK
jgi:tryptophan synthase beta chain